jgi:hypothetical protein
MHENTEFSLAPGAPDRFLHSEFKSLGNTLSIPLSIKIRCEEKVLRDNPMFHA